MLLGFLGLLPSRQTVGRDPSAAWSPVVTLICAVWSFRGMERLEFDDVGADVYAAGGTRRDLADRLETTQVALNHYRIDPGSGLPGGLHAHMDQEEVFVVLVGTAVFETLEGKVEVDSGGAVRFAPGEFQSGRNAGETPLEILAIGAPRDSEDVRLPLACPACDNPNVRVDASGDAPVFTCPDCGDQRVPAPCPECGAEAFEVTVGESDRPVVACRDCGSQFSDPPVRE